MTTRNWFDVDVNGLAKLIEDKGKVFLLHELVSNAWDTDSNLVEVELRKVAGQPRAILVVKDRHPQGFSNLSHAYTLFAESEKKGEAEKRGRFNMGEKLVLAMCIEAKITSTTGTIIFNADGRTTTKERTKEGSIFEAIVRMTQAEFDEAVREFKQVLPPNDANRVTVFNSEPLPARIPVTFFTATLPTVLSDGDGALRKTARKTQVEVYEVLPGEVASIYEMGIPVVETGDKYHVNVMQKVPLTMERDNVPPSYLKLVRGLVVNEVHERLTEEEASRAWVSQALESEAVSKEAIKSVVVSRFGENAAINDMSDREANHALVARGFTVVPGNTFSKEAWANIKGADALLPSGRIAPTPRPYAEGGEPVDILDPSKVTDSMRRVEKLSKVLAKEILGVPVVVTFVVTHNYFGAAFGSSRQRGGTATLDFNVRKLGKAWFDQPLAEVLRLIVHEFGHEYEANHLSENYHEAICKISGKLAVLALTKPEIFSSK